MGPHRSTNERSEMKFLALLSTVALASASTFRQQPLTQGVSITEQPSYRQTNSQGLINGNNLAVKLAGSGNYFARSAPQTSYVSGPTTSYVSGPACYTTGSSYTYGTSYPSTSFVSGPTTTTSYTSGPTYTSRPSYTTGSSTSYVSGPTTTTSYTSGPTYSTGSTTSYVSGPSTSYTSG